MKRNLWSFFMQKKDSEYIIFRVNKKIKQYVKRIWNKGKRWFIS